MAGKLATLPNCFLSSVMHHELNSNLYAHRWLVFTSVMADSPGCEVFSVYGKVVVAFIHELGIQNSNSGIEFLSLHFGAF